MAKSNIAECYGADPTYEWNRLIKDAYHRLEYETSMWMLKRHLPKKGTILDAGGGPGRYTISLAKRGYMMTLLDYTPQHIALAEKTILKYEVGRNVKETVVGSIVDLSRYKSNSFDAVLCLGAPLCHVKKESDRKKAVRELVRVAKPGAPIIVSVIGRLSVISLALRYWPKEIGKTSCFRDLWKRGDDNLWHGKYFSHMFRAEEIKKIFPSNITVVEMAGLEGLASPYTKEPERISRTQKKTWRNWLEAHFAMCTDPGVVDNSVHMMIVVRKR